MGRTATRTMELGVHLPLIDFGGGVPSLARILDTVQAARRHGFSIIAVHDRLTFARPCVDGLTALAAVIERSHDMTLMTAVALPVLRGPVVLARALASLDRLSHGRLVAGIGAGSSETDYRAAGVPHAERWPRFDAAARTLRQLLLAEPDSPATRPGRGDAQHCDLDDDLVRAASTGISRPPLWIGSWGTAAGLRRVARLGDGWLASAANTTPARFVAIRAALDEELRGRGREPRAFPDVVATMWLHITESRAEANRVLRSVLGPALGRTPEQLAECVCIGSLADCKSRIAAYAEAGAQRLLVCPLLDHPQQVETLGAELFG